ncbi:quinone-dependent dihydroorotate dehydrogenase [Enterovirga aerilata]|uniref:Dihydroorotate dehydrogenase (quinone) n=1 Tax=Enterovirga aerilata TaxID=2730920 RepID=A0A849ID94_9HYPH|nr:quinone-dependent dihydroorotate dehydrogenase [Enterovirga sp. DB1703]NNM75221.1 quinone-dependent dihydroorotate dehydrogenase [Enterovirga sp. DB1703]
MLDTVYRALKPGLRHLDPETAHRLAVKALACGLPLVRPAADDTILACRVFGLGMPNPIGLAAGFDKNGEVPGALLRIGFGHVEIGTVTPQPQPGNPRPRLFRLSEDEAVINRYGFNSEGLEPLLRRMAARRGQGGTVGINVGKNKETADEVADFVTGIRAAAPFAGYLVINVSSPNTPGLRDLQRRESMERLLRAALQARAEAVSGPAPPLLVKLAPDLDGEGLADAAEVALSTGIDGLIMGNTTISRPPSLRSRHRSEAGGLSGRPLFELSTRRLGELYRLTGGRIPLVGVGGVASGKDAYAKIRAGASLVQLYSALVFEGPGLVGRIKRDLAGLLRRDGWASVAEAVGADHR